MPTKKNDKLIGKWVKCPKCQEILYLEEVHENKSKCTSCNYHFRLSARRRIKQLVDADSFIEQDGELVTKDPLAFPGYPKKLSMLQEITKIKEAVMTGKAKICEQETMLAVMDGNFLMGSMGTVVGEKITRIIEKATKERLPVIIFCVSGGARMQEGIFSLMQMGKTAAALARHHEAGLLSISVLTDPTTGGVTASFASITDIILAEPKALIGFAGPRVIEQTIRQTLPKGFQTSEFLLEHGFIDKIVDRSEMREVLGNLLMMHQEGEKDGRK